MPWRESFLRLAVLLGVAVWLITESLSAIAVLNRAALTIAWAAAAAALFVFRRHWLRAGPIPRVRAWEVVGAGAALAVAGVTLTIALACAPNSADAMAYHLPRVLYWMQQQSASFYPAHYLNHLQLPPFAEYLQLHLYLLSGGDRLANLPQWAGFAGSCLVVSMVAGRFGASPRGQVLAALLCATLPNAILQASGAKNDCVLAFWLSACLYFAVSREWIWMAAAAGLAVFTKSTAYLFLPPLLLAALWPARSDWRRIAAVLPAGVLLLNGLHYWRNYELSGSPLGFDSAQGDGFFRWQNDRFGWKETLSNAMRHASEQLAGRSGDWNRGVFDAVVEAHRVLGIDPQDPATTWRWSQYAIPRNANHEADAPNRWHLLLAMLSLPGLLLARRRWAAMVLLSVGAAFLLFCFYLKWQPFQARLFLPLFVLAAPFIAIWLDKLAKPIPLLVCAFLLSGARLPLLENWTRPLEGPNSVLATSRPEEYWNDMTPWKNRESFYAVAERVVESRCREIGIDASRFQLEYPFQALVRAKAQEARFYHVNVKNPSRRYRAGDPPVCAILCMDCDDQRELRALYSRLGNPFEAGRFLLFLKP